MYYRYYPGSPLKLRDTKGRFLRFRACYCSLLPLLLDHLGPCACAYLVWLTDSSSAKSTYSLSISIDLALRMSLDPLLVMVRGSGDWCARVLCSVKCLVFWSLFYPVFYFNYLSPRRKSFKSFRYLHSQKLIITLFVRPSLACLHFCYF